MILHSLPFSESAGLFHAVNLIGLQLTSDCLYRGGTRPNCWLTFSNIKQEGLAVASIARDDALFPAMVIPSLAPTEL